MAKLHDMYPGAFTPRGDDLHLEGLKCPYQIQGALTTPDPAKVTCIECLTKMSTTRLQTVAEKVAMTPPQVLGHVKAPGRVCPTCGAEGFPISKVSPSKCTLCDGTERPTVPPSTAHHQSPSFPLAGSWPPDVAFPVPEIAPPPVVDSPPQEVPHVTASEGGGEGAVAVAPGLGTADVLSALPFCYLSGAAGTGKTYLARQLRDQREDVLFTATTGIAAVNLGDATTINSALGYSTTQSLMEQYATGFLAYKLRMLRKSGVRIIVVDEVSMMEAQQLDIITTALDEIDQKRSYDEDLEQVVYSTDDDRRLKLLLLGDFCQLAPVEGEFAFESAAWGRFTVLKLTTNRRQADEGFIKGLHHVRRGEGEAALEYFRGCITKDIDIGFNGSTIAAKNDAVERINNLRHLKVTGPLYTYKTIRSGKQDKAWVKNIPEELAIKKGALVMILANKAYPKLDPSEMSQFEYVNGDLGTVVGQDTEGVRVLLHRTFKEVTVTYALKELKEATGKKKPRWNILGTCQYMPLRLAYGTTVHKSQGLTLDNVQVLITDGFFTHPGMLYVALSRARSLEGLKIVGNEKMFVGRCGVNDKVRPWL